MADLIGQLAAGGAGVPLASALEQFKSGVQFATEQNAAGQKSKLADIAIQQGQKDLVAQDQINERRAIELDQLKKSMPLWDQQLALNMQKMAREADIEPLNFQYAVAKINSAIAGLPVEDHAKTKSAPDMEDMKQEFNLTGDLAKDRPMIKAINAATLATPQIQSAMINKQAAIESAQAVEAMRARASVEASRGKGVEAAQIAAQSRERVALIKRDTDLEKAATKAMSNKQLDVKKEDVIVAKTLLVAHG